MVVSSGSVQTKSTVCPELGEKGVSCEADGDAVKGEALVGWPVVAPIVYGRLTEGRHLGGVSQWLGIMRSPGYRKTYRGGSTQGESS